MTMENNHNLDLQLLYHCPQQQLAIASTLWGICQCCMTSKPKNCCISPCCGTMVLVIYDDFLSEDWVARVLDCTLSSGFSCFRYLCFFAMLLSPLQFGIRRSEVGHLQRHLYDQGVPAHGQTCREGESRWTWMIIEGRGKTCYRRVGTRNLREVLSFYLVLTMRLRPPHEPPLAGDLQ